MTWRTWNTWNIKVKMNHVLKTMENNPNKKTKEEKINKLLIEAMATHETLTKNLFESNLKKKETHRFTSYVTYNLSMRWPIWASMFLSKTLVLTNCCSMVVLFLTMVEKCSYTLNFCLRKKKKLIWGEMFLHWLLTAFIFEALSKYAWDFGLPTISLVSLT